MFWCLSGSWRISWSHQLCFTRTYHGFILLRAKRSESYTSIAMSQGAIKPYAKTGGSDSRKEEADSDRSSHQ